MMVRIGGSLSFILAVLFICFPDICLGQGAEKPNFEQAKKHFKSGQALLQMDRFADAIEEFNKAYEITKDGLVMGQIAMAYEKAGDYESALAALKVYRKAIPDSDREATDTLIKKYQKMISEGRSKKLTLPSEAAASEANKEAQPEEESTGATDELFQKKKPRLFYTWIAAGATGALVLGALVVGLNAQSKYDELKDTCGVDGTCAVGEVDSVKTRATIADVLWGTAAAAAITAGVFYFLERPKSQSKVDSFDGDEDDFSVQIHPVFAGQAYGLGAKIQF